MSYRCGHCDHTHTESITARACANREAAAARVMTLPDPPTIKQLAYLEALERKKGTQLTSRPATKLDASAAIKSLLEMKDAAPVTTPYHAMQNVLPLVQVNMIRAGRYALLNSAQTDLVFLRVARPQTGRSAGQTVIQTQHSDSWVERRRYASGGRVISSRRDTIKGDDLDDVLIGIASDQVGAAVTYAQHHHRCSRCGKKLTDDRSRYYGIGPECEKDWPHMVSVIEENKGEYVPGIASR